MPVIVVSALTQNYASGLAHGGAADSETVQVRGRGGLKQAHLQKSTLGQWGIEAFTHRNLLMVTKTVEKKSVSDSVRNDIPLPTQLPLAR